MVTAFCPLTITGAGETVAQTAGETRFVVDCKVNPATLVGPVKITLAPEGVMVSRGGGNVRLNIVPLPKLPPAIAVPNRVLPDKINPPGKDPSLLVPKLLLLGVKLCNSV